METVVIEKVRRYVLDNFLYMRPGFELNAEDRLLDRRILDSMAVMELVMFLREEFGIAVPEADIQETHLGSLKAIATYVTRAQGRAAGV